MENHAQSRTSGSWIFNKKLIGAMIGSGKVRRYVVTPKRRSEKDPLSLYTAVSITAGGGGGSREVDLERQLWDHDVMNC